MAMTTMSTSWQHKTSVCMKECRKVFVCSSKLESRRSRIIRRWKMFSKNSIKDTSKVSKDLLSLGWLKTNCYLRVGTSLTVLSNSKSKLQRYKLSVWLILPMVEEDIVTLTNRKSKEQLGKIWIRNCKN